MTKPFDLDKALANGCMVDGLRTRIICTNAEGDWPVVVLVRGRIQDAEFPGLYNKQGKCRYGGPPLVNITTKHEGWVNVYPCSFRKRWLSDIHPTKAEALAQRSNPNTAIDTIRIEWED